jgi:hypothetical protein
VPGPSSRVLRLANPLDLLDDPELESAEPLVIFLESGYPLRATEDQGWLSQQPRGRCLSGEEASRCRSWWDNRPQ